MAIFCAGLRPSLQLFSYILTLIHLIAINPVLSTANSVCKYHPLIMQPNSPSLLSQLHLKVKQICESSFDISHLIELTISIPLPLSLPTAVHVTRTCYATNRGLFSLLS